MERWRQQNDENTPVRYKIHGRWITSYKRNLKPPSSNSQIADEAVIKHVMRHAAFLKLIREDEIPKFKYTKFEPKRRGAFTNAEWKLIYETLRKEAHSKRKNKRLSYEVELFRHFCLVMANSGLRPNEALHLKWSDVQYYDDDDGETQVEIRVRDVGDWKKHRPRTFTAQPACHTYFERLRAIHRNTVDDAYVFERWTGERILAYTGRFNALMKSLDMYLDEEGKKRTPYSLRHYYATQRLENGADPYLLAQYMGSSLQLLEKTYAHILSRRVAKEVTKRRSRKHKPSVQ